MIYALIIGGVLLTDIKKNLEDLQDDSHLEILATG